MTSRSKSNIQINNLDIKHQVCPICSIEVPAYMARYPRLICSDCLNSADITDMDGNIVYYENESITGGFVSIHIIDNNKVIKKDHNCIIKGINCYADEHRFGGIVIQTL